MANAHLANVNWKETSYQQRADLLNKVAKIIQIKKFELAKTITLEMGKSFPKRKKKSTWALI